LHTNMSDVKTVQTKSAPRQAVPPKKKKAEHESLGFSRGITREWITPTRKKNRKKEKKKCGGYIRPGQK